MYLGVQITSDFYWSDHIHAKCSKARKLVGLLYQSNTDPATLFNLYFTLVRPHLEYTCEVWSPHLQKDMKKLEQVKKIWDSACALRCGVLTISSCYFYSIFPLLGSQALPNFMHKVVDFSQNVFVPKPPTKLRSSRSNSLFTQPFARTNTLKYSYVALTCTVWDTLLNHISDAQSFLSDTFCLLCTNYSFTYYTIQGYTH